MALKEEEMGTHTTEVQPRDDTRRRQPPVSHGKKLQKKPTPLTPDLGFLPSKTVRK